MAVFSRPSVEIAFIDEGSGPVILLIHGFASNYSVNWIGPGWVSSLVAQGRRVIAFDNRGHGGSTKFHDPDAYDSKHMAEDAAALLDHCGVKRAVVMGYSMGARISAHFALAAPTRVAGLILGGLGYHLIDGGGLPTTIAAAMEVPSLADVPDSFGRTFRAFADKTGADRVALAACIRGSRQNLTADEVASISCPTLVAVGTEDRIAGSATALAGLMQDAEALDIPGRDHNPAVGDRVFKTGVQEWLVRKGI